MANLLDTLSLPDLERLCRLCFWLSIVSDRSADWGNTRETMERYLAGIPSDLVELFREFLREKDAIHLPEDHAARVANLSEAVRRRALDLDPARFRRQSEEEALREMIPEEDSDLLLRWLTWRQEIPWRQMWWYEPTPA